MRTEPRFDFSSENKTLAKSLQFTELLKRIEAGEKSITLSGLEGSSKFFLIQTLYRAIERPLLLLCPDGKKAEAASGDLSFFLEKTPPVLARKEPRSGKSLFSSSARISSERIGWLHSALGGEVVIAEPGALLETTVPKSVFENSLVRIVKGDSVYQEELMARLLETGYGLSEFIQTQGEISRRGSIVDIFPPGRENPVRLEFIGDEIGSIRRFNPDDQKSREKVEAVTIPPASEIILNADSIKRSIKYIQDKSSAEEISARTKLTLIEEIKKGSRFSNIEWLLPAFYTDLCSALDYLPENALIITDGPDYISGSVSEFLETLPGTLALVKKQMKIAPEPGEITLTEEELEKKRAGHQRIFLPELELSGAENEVLRFAGGHAALDGGGEPGSPVDRLSEKINGCREEACSLHLVFKTDTEREKLLSLLSERGITNVSAHTGHLSHGFTLSEAKIRVLTEWDIFGEKRERPVHKRGEDVPSAFITSFSELKPGDYIVHVDFGIGVFRSLKRLRIGESEGDFIQCEYAGGDKIYVPIDRLKLVQRYIGDGKPHKVDKLGRGSWNTRVRRVRKAVENVARELLELYARRKARKGYAFSPRDDLFRQFELEFSYEETPDQEAAIEDVMSDMEKPRPMDRLICGDVGFGKTEVALRAAFKAVSDGKQVAFLVPTTLLAEQHYKTSLARLKGYPVVVESLSRFKTGREQTEIVSKLKEGKIDIVIGTHKLLSDRIKFKDLGLVIIDEEHRFGVSQKEKLRKMKEGVDALSLSATPIPRTLQLSLAKIRDISLINTPPEGRKTIETYVYRRSPEIVKEAVTKELGRGGAVFFIHNRIEDIYRVADRVKKLLPDARIGVTHGRMREKLLEKAISSFIEGGTDILVTTAIVESGLDIPRANTMIIDDAGTFGLADLYQLRGRVGRSERKAFAYLLIPGAGSLSEDARRRLKAISEFRELGSGFKLALSDLEIRGAGNLFGVEQSGHIADVGLELYLDMLEGAVRRLEGQPAREEVEPDISLSTPAFIPDDYISSDSERLLFYKRLSAVTTEHELRAISAELKDRFGEIPEPASSLLRLISLKITMKKLGIEKADIKRNKAVIIFAASSELYDVHPPAGKTEICFERQDPVDEVATFVGNLARRDSRRKSLSGEGGEEG